MTFQGQIHCYLKLTEVPLLLGDVPLSTFVSVSSARKDPERQSRSKRNLLTTLQVSYLRGAAPLGRRGGALYLHQ